MPKAGSTTWVQIFLSLVGAGVGAVDVEQRDQELQFSLPDEDHPEHQSSRRQQGAGDIQP